MKLIVHDLEETQFKEIFQNADEQMRVISPDEGLKACTGCFGCWVKTPGRCVLLDGYEDMGETLSQAEEVIFISRCCYGGYSPFVKRVLERLLPYLLPFFTIRNNETHHKLRYQHLFQLTVYFYGEKIDGEERQVAEALVSANATNFQQEHSVSFFESPFEIKEAQIL